MDGRFYFPSVENCNSHDCQEWWNAQPLFLASMTLLFCTSSLKQPCILFIRYVRPHVFSAEMNIESQKTSGAEIGKKGQLQFSMFTNKSVDKPIRSCTKCNTWPCRCSVSLRMTTTQVPPHPPNNMCNWWQQRVWFFVKSDGVGSGKRAGKLYDTFPGMWPKLVPGDKGKLMLEGSGIWDKSLSHRMLASPYAHHQPYKHKFIFSIFLFYLECSYKHAGRENVHSLGPTPTLKRSHRKPQAITHV